ncbi:putative cytochrome P450 [Helianthus debilis subsp. tardiflorus]
MDETHLFFISFFCLVPLIYLIKLLTHQKGKNLPPSPPSIPIIGHLHLINGHAHRVLQHLSSKYGPIMALRFGSRLVVVITSPSAVEECFTKNDIILANRPLLLSGKYLDYNQSTVGAAPYGQLWRDLRRIMTLELFSTARLKSYTGVREDEVRSLIKNLYRDSFQNFTKVEMRSRIQGLSFNIVMKMIADKRFYGTGIEDLEEASQFRDVIRDVFEESEPEYYTDDIIKGNILTLLQAGTDTSSVTIEWAMALLLNHPEVLERARTELDNYIGQERMVEEADLTNLPYFQCIINETLRLFPAGPMLVPHEPSQDCTIGGFDVARGTMVLVNAWAIHRDPMVWDDSLSFKPERFENVANEGYRFIPFGMGRRRCPGSSLANRVMGLALASLIQCFEWERVGNELVRLSEGKGLTMPKDEPLKAMCRVRQRTGHILKEI